MNAMSNKFGKHIICVADGQEKQFTDGYVLDAHYLGNFRPRLLSIKFLLRLRISGYVEQDSASESGETVVIETQYGATRIPRCVGESDGMTVSWKRDEGWLKSLNLRLSGVRDGITDRKCIWVTPGDMAIACFIVYPNEFSANESIADLVTEAKRCIKTELLDFVEPA